MFAYYKFDYQESCLESLAQELFQYESELQKTDSFCLYYPLGEETIYYCCAEKDMDDIVFLQELSDKSIPVFEITKEEFAESTKVRGKVFGSKRCLALSRRSYKLKK